MTRNSSFPLPLMILQIQRYMPSWNALANAARTVHTSEALVALVLLVTGLTPSMAQVQHTQLELAMLPDYCQARLVGDEAIRKVWLQRMGQDFYHLHHYCSGLTAMRRASTETDSRKRAQNLEFAVKEFEYVLKNWTADFYLVKNAQQQRTLAMSLLGRRAP